MTHEFFDQLIELEAQGLRARNGGRFDEMESYRHQAITAATAIYKALALAAKKLYGEGAVQEVPRMSEYWVLPPVGPDRSIFICEETLASLAAYAENNARRLVDIGGLKVEFFTTALLGLPRYVDRGK